MNFANNKNLLSKETVVMKRCWTFFYNWTSSIYMYIEEPMLSVSNIKTNCLKKNLLILNFHNTIIFSASLKAFSLGKNQAWNMKVTITYFVVLNQELWNKRRQTKTRFFLTVSFCVFIIVIIDCMGKCKFVESLSFFSKILLSLNQN